MISLDSWKKISLGIYNSSLIVPLLSGLHGFWWQIFCYFSLATFKIFSLSPVFRNGILHVLGIFLWAYLVWDSYSFFLCRTLMAWIVNLLLLSYRSLMTCSFFSFFFLFFVDCSDWLIFILSSVHYFSLVHSILLLSPSTKLFISFIIFFSSKFLFWFFFYNTFYFLLRSFVVFTNAILSSVSGMFVIIHQSNFMKMPLKSLSEF